MKRTTKKEPSTSEQLGRIMPQAIELEEAILGAVMLEKGAFEIANNILTAEMFYSKVNELIFGSMVELEENRQPIDMLTVVEQLRKKGDLDIVGGPYTIAQLSQKVVSTAHLEYHCMVVKEKYLRRKLIDVCSTNTGLSFDESEDLDDLVAKASGEIEQLQEIMIGRNDTAHLSQACSESIQEMHIRIDNQRNGIMSGIPTPFADLNRLLNGWKKKKFILLAARPSVGKTSLAIKIAKTAAEHGHPVVIFSLEMGKTELTDKMIVGEADISADHYESGCLSAEESNKAESAMYRISKLPIYVDDNPMQTVVNIGNKARLLKKQGKCSMAIIDYLQLIKSIGKDKIREQQVSEISRLLKVYSKELDIPIIALSQMNRDIEGENRDPRLSDLRESGSLEQDADIIIFITRPGMHSSDVIRDKKTDEVLENCIKLFVKKHRGGKLGEVKVKHNQSLSNFYDWDSRGYSNMFPTGPVPVNYSEPAKERNEEMPF